MAETPKTPDTPDDEGLEALEEDLARALDVDDLPEPQSEAVPPAPEVVERPAEPAPPEPATEDPATPEPAQPSVAATLEVPPLAGEAGASAEAGGGEFEMLLAKVREWIGSGEPQAFLRSIAGPLKALAYLIGALLLLRVYGTVVRTIDGIPLIGGLLELAGLIAVVRYALLNLLRSEDRQKALGDWKRRWSEFRGRV
jgi:hypothetical protein